MHKLSDRLTAQTDDHDCGDAVEPAPTQAGARFECQSCGALFKRAVAT
jgi:hypothetical protein